MKLVGGKASSVRNLLVIKANFDVLRKIEAASRVRRLILDSIVAAQLFDQSQNHTNKLQPAKPFCHDSSKPNSDNNQATES